MPAALQPALNAAPIVVSLRTPEPDEKGRIPLPGKILVTPWGHSTALDGSPVIVDEETLAVLSGNQAKLGRSEIVLDFEHNTVPGDKAKPEPHKNASTGTLSVERGEGIFFHPAFWTPEGTDHYTGRHYRDISPTVIRDKSGRVIALHSVALTRAGQIEGLHAFSAEATLTALSALSKPTDPDPEKQDAMKDLLCQILKLDPANASDEEITAAATKMLSAPAPEKKEDDAVPAPMSADASAAATARMDSFEKRQLISDAKLSGKIIPFSAPVIEAMDLTTLSAVIADLPAGQVPTAAKTPGEDNGNAGQPKALSAEETQIAKLLNIDPKKYADQLAASAI